MKLPFIFLGISVYVGIAVTASGASVRDGISVVIRIVAVTAAGDHIIIAVAASGTSVGYVAVGGAGRLQGIRLIIAVSGAWYRRIVGVTASGAGFGHVAVGGAGRIQGIRLIIAVSGA